MEIQLSQHPVLPTKVDDIHYRIETSTRAIRYAITELIKSGRARRDGKYGPVYAVVRE